MKLTINGRQQTFIPLHIFREQWDLPDDFGLTCFERKDWQVGHMETSGQVLAQIKQQVIETVPQALTTMELLPQVQILAANFGVQLQTVNTHIGLRQVEIDYAVDGFQNVLHDVAYALLALHQTHQGDIAKVRDNFNFAAIYQAWLDASTQILARRYTYDYGDRHLAVQVVYNAYGRIGLQITVADDLYYVLDPVFSCPAANYIEDLCRQVSSALCKALVQLPTDYADGHT